MNMDTISYVKYLQTGEKRWLRGIDMSLVNITQAHDMLIRYPKHKGVKS